MSKDSSLTPGNNANSISPTAGYSVTIRIKVRNVPGTFSRFVQHVANHRASLAEMSLLFGDFNYKIREVTVHCSSEDHARDLVAGVGALEGIELISSKDDTLEVHKNGKLSVEAKHPINTTDQLARVYTPGVARVCLMIKDNPELAYEYTVKSNTVAVVTDGTAVLGLGDIGPKAALPVMEGKAALFKHFAGIDAFPIALDSKDPDKLVEMITALSPGFGGINLEDISSPRCFEIEERLRAKLDIPVFHDDQHGTAIVVLAGLLNALRVVGKSLDGVKVVVNGFGAAGVACTRMLSLAGCKNIVPVDRFGIVAKGQDLGVNPGRDKLLETLNPNKETGSLSDAIRGADVFLGLSRPGVLRRSDVELMAKDPIVFALANPTPEIMPEEIRDLAKVIATGRSDYENQINNVLAFPGIFRGALDCRASDVTDQMKLAAAKAIADIIPPNEIHEHHIIPSVFHPGITEKVAEAVRAAALKDGVAKIGATCQL